MQCKATTKAGHQCTRNAQEGSVFCFQHQANAKGLKLNDKQQKFCEEYINDRNGAKAAIRAGYSENTARSIASELLTKPNVKQYINKLTVEQTLRTQIDADRVIEEIAKIAFVDITDFISVNSVEKFDKAGNVFRVDVLSINDLELLKDKTPAIQAIKETENGIQIKTHAKTRALEKLLDHVAVDKNEQERLKLEKERIMLERERIALQRKQIEIQEEKAGLGEKDKEGTGVIILPEATEGDE